MKEICARITWAIIDDRRSFFGQNPVASNFAPGATFQFLTSYLEGITDAVRNAIPIHRATFPREWAAQPNPPTIDFGVPPPGAPPTQWTALPPTAPQPPPPTRTTMPPAAKEDIRHPKIKQLMDPYLKKYNNYFNLSDILTASGKRMTDLPTIQKLCHPTGQPYLCWNSVLGKCFRGSRCKYSRGHIKRVTLRMSLPMQSPTASEKAFSITLTSPQGRDPPTTSAKEREGD